MKIAVAIPTYNRKEVLVKCLEAVAGQTLRPECIYVVDNHSTDVTPELLHSLNYDKDINGVRICYNYLPENGGGAMGFSLGMETALKDGGYDAFWMLDDDGLPAEDCLEILSRYVRQYGYVSPVLMDINNPEKLNGACKGSYDPEVLHAAYGGGELMPRYCNPFNGGLFSIEAVKKVGIPKRELFIYGDEMNYDMRMTEAGFPSYGVFSARHLHPVMQDTDVHFLVLGHFKPVKWKMYCMSRNKVYNKKIQKRSVLKKSLVLAYYYLISEAYLLLFQRSWDWMKLFHKAFSDGLNERWGGEREYMQTK